MRVIFLILAWVTPAFIAGALGWKGIWGGNSAFFDYLVPIPVAGGVFHVPSFGVAAIIISSFHKYPENLSRLVPLAAFSVFLVAQSLQIDFERLHAWMFTDYSPARSPLRFGKNPLLLFIVTDALWVWVYTLAHGYGRKIRYYVPLFFIPLLMIGVTAVSYGVGGPKFDYGFSSHTSKRGNGVVYVYTSSRYEEKLFREWFDSTDIINRPWHWNQVENVAVYFTNSMQDIKWRNVNATEKVIATFCLYEDDQSLHPFSGYRDCFAGRLTLEDRMNESFDNTKTELGTEIDRWYAMARLCEGVEVPERFTLDVELVNFCRSLKSGFERERKKIVEKFGEDSEQVKFMDERADLVGL